MPDERFRAALSLCSDLRALARDVVIKWVNGPKAYEQGVMLMFVARATAAVESVELLTRHGLNIDAMSVMRTVCELDIDLAYIAKDDTVERLRLFLGHAYIRRYEQAVAVGGLDPDTAAEFLRARDSVKANYPKRWKWAGKSTEELARETGREIIYSTIYDEGSSAIHSGASTLYATTAAAETDDEIRHTFLFGPQHPSPEPLELAAVSYAALLGTIVRYCDIGEFAPGLAALSARVSAQLASDDESRGAGDHADW